MNVSFTVKDTVAGALVGICIGTIGICIGSFTTKLIFEPERENRIIVEWQASHKELLTERIINDQEHQRQQRKALAEQEQEIAKLRKRLDKN